MKHADCILSESGGRDRGGKRGDEGRQEKEKERGTRAHSLTKGELFLSIYTVPSPFPYSSALGSIHSITLQRLPCVKQKREATKRRERERERGREGERERVSRRFFSLRCSPLTVVIQENFNATAFGHSEKRRLRSDVKAGDSHCEDRICMDGWEKRGVERDSENINNSPLSALSLSLFLSLSLCLSQSFNADATD